MIRRVYLLATLTLACSGARSTNRQEPVASVDETSLDRSVEPCQDFYQFACGGWMKSTPIPPDRSRWVRSFSEIDKRNEEKLRTLLEAASASKTGDNDSRKLGDLYATCMDDLSAETASQKVLHDLLAAIDGIDSQEHLAAEVAALQLEGIPVLFGFRQQQDFKNAKEVIAGADQGGLGLPDRDMYEDARFEGVRKAYLEHIAAQLQLAGESAGDAKAHAAKVMEIETALAKVSLPRAERRKPENVYHRIDRAGLVAAAPHFAWTAYFIELGRAGQQALNVAVPAFFAGLDAQLTSVSLADWKTYLRAHVLDAAADRLGKAWVDEKFHYTSAAFTGAKEDLPRWKKCVAFVDGSMGQALGRLFVKDSFGDEGKAVAKQMIQDIEKAFEQNLDTVPWMDAAARTASLDKLHKVFNKVGFADHWRDYSTLGVDRKSYLGNAMAAAAFETRRQLAKIGKPLDRTDWGMTPPQVNAYYNAGLNEMVFPAGILQVPFFGLSQDDAANYGAAGYVMGHELTHGFDDQGRRFDGDGNLREWWTPEVAKAYEERATCVAKQYEGYTVLDDMHLNGRLTLGENIADIGGLKLAYRAWKLHRGDRPAGNKAGGFTDDQRFFLSAAQVWCENTRDEQVRTRVKTDSHSPGRYRVIGPLTDDPDFAAAFQCQAGSRMAPKDHCEVW